MSNFRKRFVVRSVWIWNITLCFERVLRYVPMYWVYLRDSVHNYVCVCFDIFRTNRSFYIKDKCINQHVYIYIYIFKAFIDNYIIFPLSLSLSVYVYLSIYWALAPPGIPGQVAQRTGFRASPWGFWLSVFVFSMKKSLFRSR